MVYLNRQRFHIPDLCSISLFWLRGEFLDAGAEQRMLWTCSDMTTELVHSYEAKGSKNHALPSAGQTGRLHPHNSQDLARSFKREMDVYLSFKEVNITAVVIDFKGFFFSYYQHQPLLLKPFSNPDALICTEILMLSPSAAALCQFSSPLDRHRLYFHITIINRDCGSWEPLVSLLHQQ